MQCKGTTVRYLKLFQKRNMNNTQILAVSATALFLCFTAQGAQRSEQEALQLAKKFLSSDKISLQSAALNATANSAAMRDSDTSGSEDFSPYYIYSNDEADGFVILSGSDLMAPVLGYSDRPFDADNVPANMSAWLQQVSDVAAYVEANPESVQTSATRLSTASSSAITPLLGDIAWDQSYPFNLLCPTTSKGAQTIVGCVATAGAQLMYYYRYPATGTGSHTDAFDKTLTVDFSAQTYDYDLMFDKYSSRTSYTNAQLNEVAKLSYHCGVAADMDYGDSSEGSSSVEAFLRRGLVKNFGYDPLAECISRECYTYDEWVAILTNELEHSRPIIYGGVSEAGGHCFIVDGLDSDGLFHVNWGWAGECNGYFDITLLDADEDEVFCDSHSAIVQLAPKGTISDGHYIPSLMPDGETFSISTTSATLGNSVTVSLPTIYNFSTDTLKFKIGLAFVQGDDIAGYSTTSSVYTISGVDYDTFSFKGISFSSQKVKVPTTLADGTYRVYVCAVPTSGDMENEVGLLHFSAKWPSYYDCTVASGKASFSRGSTTADVSVSDWSFDTETPTVGYDETITCKITNNDTSNTLVGKFYLMLKSPNGASRYVEANETSLTLAPSATQTLSFDYTFSINGTWTAALYIYYVNIDDDPQEDRTLIVGTSRTFTVTTDSSEGADLTLMAAPALVTSDYYGDSLFVDEPATFRLTIKNDGEAYDGRMQIQLFRTTTSTTVMATVTADVSVEANAPSDTYTLSGLLTKVADNFRPAKSGTTYYARAFYAASGYYANFTLASGITNRVAVKCYSGAPTVSALDEVSADDSDASDATYNLLGQQVSPSAALKSGFYVKNGKKLLVR